MVRHNGLSLIGILNLGIVVTFFDIQIEVRSNLNKLNRFMSVFTQLCDCVHAKQLARKGSFQFGLLGGNIGL